MKILSAFTLLLAGFNLAAQTQTISNIDGLVAPGIMGGNPPSSYALSGIDHVNFYNGNLNVVIPLLTVGGRGNAGYTMVVPIQRRGRCNAQAVTRTNLIRGPIRSANSIIRRCPTRPARW